MTGSTSSGSIQPQQDSAPILDDSLFTYKEKRLGHYILRRASKSIQHKMMNPAIQSVQPIQLTPLWEYVVRMKKFPKNANVVTIFDEISERLRDPEWEVRQHALRVLIDVLPTLSTDFIDDITSLVLPDLIDNLGNTAPAVRKGSLDAIRIYLLHTPRRDELTKRILQDGLNRADILDHYQTNVARGIILSIPLLLFPSRSSIRPSTKVVRQAIQALAMRLVQVAHQESAFRSLSKIREVVGEKEFSSYLWEVDDSLKHNFELLCDVYRIQDSLSTTAKTYLESKKIAKHSMEGIYQQYLVNESIIDVVTINKSLKNQDEASDIFEENEDNSITELGDISSTRIVLETEIKFNKETAIMMTILEKEETAEEEPINKSEDEAHVDEDIIETLPIIEAPYVSTSSKDRQKNFRRVHFGGEIVKLRTPDSEDTESVISETHRQSVRTRIPLPVSPATRMPSERRARSSSQPGSSCPRFPEQQRSASSSPKRELHTHDASLSPKKSILTKSSAFTDSSHRIASQIQRDSKYSFDIYDEPGVSYSSKIEDNILQRNTRSHSPNLLGDICSLEEKRIKGNVDYVFGDKSDIEFIEKMRKDHDNLILSVYRSKSAEEKTTKFEWRDEVGMDKNAKEQRHIQSAKSPDFKVFPCQERNYILMELSSPIEDFNKGTSLEDNISIIDSNEELINDNSKMVKSDEKKKKTSIKGTNEKIKVEMVDQLQDDSNKRLKSEKVKTDVNSKLELSNEIVEGIVEEDIEKTTFNAKERCSDSSSDGESKNKELNWEDLGLIDDEILNDFHNKNDWRARVRGLEHIASTLRIPSALTIIEPRLDSLLHAVLGGERSCRVAAAGLEVAKVVLTEVSEETLKNHLSLIAWGLARQGGPNAAYLARLTMLKTNPGLFLEKLLQPQCVAARNAKMRENTLQLLIFSLVTFPSTEFKAKSAIDKVVSMVGDHRKRVRHSALDTLAVLSQIYESENILEASKRFIRGKQDGQLIYAAIKTRLSRKLLPTVSMDGLVVYGLQISSNFQYSGADVEWIVAGTGSISPGTGRTRGQLIAVSKMKTDIHKQNFVPKQSKNKSMNEYHKINKINTDVLEMNENIPSRKFLPQLNQNDKQSQEIQLTKIDRISKSAELTKDFQLYSEKIGEKINKPEKLYGTLKRIDRKSELEIYTNTKLQLSKQIKSNQIRGSSSAPVPRQESRIPIYKGAKLYGMDMSKERSDEIPIDTTLMTRWQCHRDQQSDSKINQKQRQKHYSRNPPLVLNYAYSYPKCDGSFESIDAELQTKFKEGVKNSPLQSFKDNNQRTYSYEKLSKGFNTVIKNSSTNLRSVPNCQYLSNATEKYESIYQRQHRLREEKGSEMFETAPTPISYGYEYVDYIINANNLHQNNINIKNVPIDNQSIRKKLFSPFDKRLLKKSSKISDKEMLTCLKTDSKTETIFPADSEHISNKRISSSYRDVDEVRQNSDSSLSSNRSVTSNRRVESHEILPAFAESDESNKIVERNSPTSSLCIISNDKVFDIISRNSNPSTPDIVSISSDMEEELEQTSSVSLTKLSQESLMEGGGDADGAAGDFATPTSSKLYSRGSSKLDLRITRNKDFVEDSECPENENAVKILNLKNAAGDTKNGASKISRSPIRSQASYTCNINLQNSNSKYTFCNSNGFTVSPRSISPRNFINEELTFKETDSDETQPLSIGCEGANQTESSDGTDEIDGFSVRPQLLHLQTPIDLTRKTCKVSPCKTRPQINCNRVSSVSGNRHHEKYTEKAKVIQQCFEKLESKDWEMTLKGLKALTEIAKDEPEQLDNCAPGLLARVLGKHVKNLRSQVARVACSTASQVFGAHIRGIDQDLDEIAGPLLHRTADTNKFLREDCNSALDSMIEHFPPHRTILTIANRGASHQNTIVHATTARLLLVTVIKIGPEHIMILPRDVKDKLFVTTAKLLTDGNSEARKHAKETFRLLSRCEGFRKTLIDAVPENTLRLIDKTLRSL